MYQQSWRITTAQFTDSVAIKIATYNITAINIVDRYYTIATISHHRPYVRQSHTSDLMPPHLT